SSRSSFLWLPVPALFGVNLRYFNPCVIGLIGGAAGGFLASVTGLEASGMAIPIIPGTLLYLNEQIIMYILVNLMANAVALVLTWLFGYSDKQKEKIEED